jgi:alkyldihydroxyacetonephosphate synthase
LRLHRLPEARFLAAYQLPSFADALTSVRLALREEASPTALRIYDYDEACVHLGGDVCKPGEAILVAATSGPTSLASCDRDLISSAVDAMAGVPMDQAIAHTWWNRRTGYEESDSPPPAPNLQVSATPRRLAPVYDAILGAASNHGFKARAHGSRFARDGGVLFFTIHDEAGNIPKPNDSKLFPLKKDAEVAGAYLLESTNTSLATYFETLRDSLDPHRHLNPGVMRLATPAHHQ